MVTQPAAARLPPPRRRPTRADHEAWARFQGSALARVLEDAKAWRNGYAMLAGGIGVLLGLVGDRLDESTPWGWRLALSLTFGTALVLIAWALWLALTIEGGSRIRTVNLAEIVERHNSFEMYEADQAAQAVARLGRSRRLAVAASVCTFVGLLVTLWLPSSADEAPTPVTSTSTPGTPSAPTRTPPPSPGPTPT